MSVSYSETEDKDALLARLRRIEGQIHPQLKVKEATDASSRLVRS